MREEAPAVALGSVLDATTASIKAASHLTDMDAGAVAALLVVAAKLDALSDGHVESLEDLKAKFDNVTVPTYLKYCDALGLTPAGRVRLEEKKETPGGKLAHLRSANRPANRTA